MDTRLATENRWLRARLEALIETARETEDKLNRLADLEFRLLQAGDLSHLLRLLLQDLKRDFELDHVGLVLCDTTGDLQAALEGHPLGEGWPLRLIPDPAPLQGLHTPVLGPAGNGHTTVLLPEEMEGLASHALLPLGRGDPPRGILLLGSHGAERYTPDQDTFLLRRLAAIVSVCLENALAHWRLREMGVTDPLTGVRNRRFFDQRLQDEIGRMDREGHALACLFIDIDHFKRVNDRHGHAAGDRVIAAVAQRLARHLRRFDLLARYGGEEFVILLPALDDSELQSIAERMRHTVAATPVPVEDHRAIQVTVSIGGARLPPGGQGQAPEARARILLGSADHALLRAKETGRNRVEMAAEGLYRQEAGPTPPVPAGAIPPSSEMNP
ncbi:GGDEF domain-containing protein [Ectothiorhodospira mobilis]|uniref:GGDEF domain-containing protein n=1 Tax=Ectothiorhodospira mobilis TaxID=195064 RepID=UPI0019035B6D|nr:sensor domain-containing diguanylate cyclase [Ectothiorhodospira mobilis]MBK1690894.1 hypothetical protein [Ectothiorhodospira mobilis]